MMAAIASNGSTPSPSSRSSEKPFELLLLEEVLISRDAGFAGADIPEASNDALAPPPPERPPLKRPSAVRFARFEPPRKSPLGRSNEPPMSPARSSRAEWE